MILMNRMLRRGAGAVLLAVVGLTTGCESSSASAAVHASASRQPVISSTPPPPPVHRASPARVRAASGNPYAYLNAAPRYAPAVSLPAGFPRGIAPAAKPHAWRYIVLHHSDTPTGSAAVFDRYHREVKKWDGLGYHLVIGNGTGSRDGQIEIGPRWTRQQTGAHAGVVKYNEDGIGICLVGDFERTRPSPAQLQATARLVAYLMKTYRIPAANVIGHKDIRGTNCPGRFFSVAQVKRLAGQYALLPLTGPDLQLPPDMLGPQTRLALAGQELLRDAPARN